MSVTFYPAYEQEDGTIRMLRRCDCHERYYDACMAADAAGQDLPEPFHCEICEIEMNLGSVNALDLLEWLGMPRVEYGHVKATELAAKCRRRLWDEERNHDPVVEGFERKTPGRATLVSFGRDAGYLRNKTERLLQICEAAGDKLVGWA